MPNTQFWSQDEINNKVFDEAINSNRVVLNGSLIPETQSVPVKRVGDSTSNQTALARDIYSTTQQGSLLAPAGSRGIVILLRIYGVTGTSPTLKFQTALLPLDNFSSIDQIDSSQRSDTSIAILAHHWYPGIAAIDATAPSGIEIKRSAMPVVNRLWWRILIGGTYNTDEGWDCTILYRWIA